eukprot:scaffold442_cov268-Pinguiococcus_pyrenoidosus.AAC.3
MLASFTFRLACLRPRGCGESQLQFQYPVEAPSGGWHTHRGGHQACSFWPSATPSAELPQKPELLWLLDFWPVDSCPALPALSPGVSARHHRPPEQMDCRADLEGPSSSPKSRCRELQQAFLLWRACANPSTHLRYGCQLLESRLVVVRDQEGRYGSYSACAGAC